MHDLAFERVGDGGEIDVGVRADVQALAALKALGPIWSRKMKGPTIWRWDDGSATDFEAAEVAGASLHPCLEHKKSVVVFPWSFQLLIQILKSSNPRTSFHWLFRTDLLEIPARTEDERRYPVIGHIDRKHWSAVITYRSDAIRIISVRRSRAEEVALYES